MNKLKIFLLILVSLMISRPAFAEEEVASPSAEEVNQNIIQRFQNLPKDKLDAAEEDLKEKQEKSALVGYSGVISKMNDLSLVVDTKDAQLQVITSTDTDIVRNGQAIKSSSLAIEEKIIIIGQLNTEDILSAKRIVAIKNTIPTFKRQTIIGPISNLDIDTSEPIIGEFETSILKNSDIDTEEIENDAIVMAIIETDIEDQTHTILSLQLLLQ